jgi:hypothetical protein
VIESVSIEREQDRVSLGLDGGGSRGIIEKRKLSETLSGEVNLQMLGLLALIELLEAVQLSLIDHKKHVSVFSLSYDGLTHLKSLLLHGIHDHLFFGGLQGLKHESHGKPVIDPVEGLNGLVHDLGHELLLLIEHAEHFSADYRYFQK